VTRKIESDTPLFRQNAINSLNAINDIQGSLKVIQPGYWLIILAFLSILIGVGIWSMYGKVSLIVEGKGIFIPSDKVQKSETFFVESLKDREQAMNSIKEILDRKKELYRDHFLTSVELAQSEKEYVIAKEESASPLKGSYINIQRPSFKVDVTASSPEMEALVFVGHIEGKRISAGMKVYILPGTLSPYEFGYIVGHITSVSEYPASKEWVYSYLGNMNLVDDFFSGEAPFIVKIKLDVNAKTKSGLSWTTKNGSPFKIDEGTSVSAKIVYKESHPYQLLTKQITSG
jgi:hypothetical protein